MYGYVCCFEDVDLIDDVGFDCYLVYGDCVLFDFVGEMFVVCVFEFF